MHPMMEYYNGLGLGDINLNHCPLQTTKSCPSCNEGKLTILSYKSGSRHLVCTHTRIHSTLGTPIPDIGCGYIHSQVISIS
jgi:hypothetical protein